MNGEEGRGRYDELEGKTEREKKRRVNERDGKRVGTKGKVEIKISAQRKKRKERTKD